MSLQIKTSFTKNNLNKSLCDPKIEKERIVKMGVNKFEIVGIPIGEYSLSEGVSLFTEDDIELLLEGAINAEEFVADPSETEHYVTLNDGGLEIVSEKDSGNVNIEFTYYPGLDAAKKVGSKITVTSSEYLNWWRNIVSTITSIVA